MTENDTDIDFDFFEDEPPTQETSRTERLIPRRGPRGPQQPPRAPTNLTPLLRLIGLIAFAILVVVLLVIWVQSCQETGKDKTYKSYMGKVSDVAGSSAQIGKQLSSVLLAQGLKEAQVEQKVAALARQMQRLLASDVIFEDSFKAPAAAELDRQGVTGTNESGGPLVPDSNFL